MEWAHTHGAFIDEMIETSNETQDFVQFFTSDSGDGFRAVKKQGDPSLSAP